MSQIQYILNPIFKICIIVLLLLFYSSCEKELSIDFPKYTKMLVVEGWIEQGKSAKVILTYNAGYFDNIDSTNLRNYVATHAKVTIYDSVRSEILTLKANDTYFPPIYYFGSQIIGKCNLKYSIKIEDSGNLYEATTSIPDLVIPDSIWFEKNYQSDTIGLLWIELADNINTDNFYRLLTKRVGKDKNFVPSLTSTFDDQLFNGNKIRLSFSKGNSNILEIGESKYFHTGDTLVIKFCSIDKNHFDFWQSIQNSIISSANPFATNKTEISSNFENALGIWGGYAAYYDTIIAK
jgi:hypothetical protein